MKSFENKIQNGYKGRGMRSGGIFVTSNGNLLERSNIWAQMKHKIHRGYLTFN